MRFKRIQKFTSSVTKGLLSTQQATLSHIVCSMIVCRSLCLAELARCLQSTTDFRHNLKRVWRFVSNDRINDRAAREVVARRLIRQLHHRLEIKPKQHLEIILDWIDEENEKRGRSHKHRIKILQAPDLAMERLPPAILTWLADAAAGVRTLPKAIASALP